MYRYRRHLSILACLLALLAQAEHNRRLYARLLPAESRLPCATFELHRTDRVYSENELKSNETRCFSTTRFETAKVGNRSSSQFTASARTGATRANKKKNVFVLVIESLGFTKFLDQMPLTKSVLEEFGVTWFIGMHVREGGTRENLPSMFFGRPLKYSINVAEGNYSAVFNLTTKILRDDAIWRVAQRSGYHTLYGSTACNLLFGLHHVATMDGLIWHNIFEKSSDFMETFPFGAYYTPSDKERDCTRYQDAHSAEGILRCSTTGPYHHKFFEYYKDLHASGHAGLPRFTIAQLLEPHGNYIYWPIDFHTSEFLRWILSNQDTMVFFLGDHAEVGDPLTTPIGLVLPRTLRHARKKLRELSGHMLLNDNFYIFLREYFESGDIKRATEFFEGEVKKNKCSDHENLVKCHCDPEGSRFRTFDQSVVDRAVEHINSQSKGAKACAPLKLEEYRNVQVSLKEMNVELLFAEGPLFHVKFLPHDAISVKQLTRYSSQIHCTPEKYHPEFCLCNVTAFKEQNALFNN